MSTFWYLVAGLVLTWAGVFVYVWLLARRADSMQQRLDALEKQLEQDQAG